MKGLVRNNFYSMATNLQLAFAIAFILIFAPSVLGDVRILSMVLAVQSFMFVANTGSALNVDITSKWSNFELAMPVRRRDIVTARYISFGLLTLLGIFMSALTLLLTAFVFKTLIADDLIFGFACGVSLSLITASLMHPIMLKFGTEKNELIICICAGIAAGLFFIVFRISRPFIPNNLMISRQSVVGLVFVVFAMILFIVSYMVSLAIYKRKEL